MEEEEKENKSTKGESLMKGTFILTIAGIVVKIIGSLNWIFVSRVLGGEGIGQYQMAFPIYFFALSVSTAGVPVAISIITAERVAEFPEWEKEIRMYYDHWIDMMGDAIPGME